MFYFVVISIFTLSSLFREEPILISESLDQDKREKNPKLTEQMC